MNEEEEQVLFGGKQRTKAVLVGRITALGERGIDTRQLGGEEWT